MCRPAFMCRPTRLPVVMCRSANAVDFDDMMTLTTNLLESHPAVLERTRERYQHLLVDEFQDTSSLQLKLISLLLGDRSSITVVGDDDQTIYSFRGDSLTLPLKPGLDQPQNQSVISLFSPQAQTQGIFKPSPKH